MTMKRILGICDSVTTCECCGRTNLKRTIVIGSEEGEAYYGSVCASKFLGGSGSQQHVTRIERKAQERQVLRSQLTAFVAKLWTVVEGRYETSTGNQEKYQVWRQWVRTNGHACKENETPFELLLRTVTESGNQLQAV